MKTIEDVVIRFDGLWQECFDVGFAPLGLNRSEFESAAKRLGFVGKYRWGAEYPTNGKRPDLPDDVWVVCFGYDGVNCGDGRVFERRWDLMEKFKITDLRYKPADTSYLNAVSEIAQPINKPEDGKIFDGLVSSIDVGKIATGDTGGKGPIGYNTNKNNWHELGELPPVGCDDFEWSLNGESWEHGLILFNDGTTCLIANKKYPANRHHLKSCDPDLRFRPIRTHREKVIEAAENGMLTSRVSNVQRKTIKRLYDLGMLVIPGANCNTKD